jgi:hypothetical protein
MEKVSGSGRHIWHKWHKSLQEILISAPMLSVNWIPRQDFTNSFSPPDVIDLAQPGPAGNVSLRRETGATEFPGILGRLTGDPGRAETRAAAGRINFSIWPTGCIW